MYDPLVRIQVLSKSQRGTPIPFLSVATEEAVQLSTTELFSNTPSSGSVTGILMNASGGSISAGQQVMLHSFDQMQLVYTATTQTRSDGTYAFDNVLINPGRSFLSTVDYQGVVYSSEFLTAEKPSSSIELPIQVYDLTSDASILSMDRLHFFFEFLDPSTVRIIELYVISNPTMLTLVASEIGKPVVNFSLPKGASGVEFDDGESGWSVCAY